MSTPGNNARTAAAEASTAGARHSISRRFVERTVCLLGAKETFLQSQSWAGYERACESWHTALWQWVDEETPADFAKGLQPHVSMIQNLDSAVWEVRRPSDGALLYRFDWTRWCIQHRVDISKLPCPPAQRKRFLLEMFLQERLLRRAVFQYAMRGGDAEDPETYSLFANDIALANRIGDDSYNRELAKQKRRKPSKDKGDRSLRYLLLVWWIPGYLWARSAQQIGSFLRDRYDVRTYHVKVIQRAYRGLKLFHLAKPIHTGA